MGGRLSPVAQLHEISYGARELGFRRRSAEHQARFSATLRSVGAPDPLVLRHRPSGSLIEEKDRSLSGIEWLRAVMERRVPDPPIMRMTGMRTTDVGLGQTTMAMPASPWWQTGAGVFMAGTLSFLADAPLGGAVLTAAQAGIGMTTSELSIDFLRPATIRSGTLIGRGKLIHSTRSQGLSEVFMEDARDVGPRHLALHLVPHRSIVGSP